MTIVATQTFPGPAWAELPEVTLLESWPPAEPMPDVDVLIEAVVAVGPDELDLLPGLRLVANYGVGYDRVDVPACRKRGVAVTNTPGVLAKATPCSCDSTCRGTSSTTTATRSAKSI